MRQKANTFHTRKNIFAYPLSLYYIKIFKLNYQADQLVCDTLPGRNKVARAVKLQEQFQFSKADTYRNSFKDT